MQRQYLLHPGAVGVIAWDDADRIAVVRQYRHPVGFQLVEPPAGLLDADDESWLAAAQRELAEEAGLRRRALAGAGRPVHHARSEPGVAADLPGPRPGVRSTCPRASSPSTRRPTWRSAGRPGPTWWTRCSPAGCRTRPWWPASSRSRWPGCPVGSTSCDPPTRPGRPAPSADAHNHALARLDGPELERLIRGYLDHLTRRAGRFGAHRRRLPARPDPLRRVPRRTGDHRPGRDHRGRRLGVPRPHLQEPTDGRRPLSVASATRSLVAVRSLHPFAASGGAGRREPRGGGPPAEDRPPAAEGARHRPGRGTAGHPRSRHDHRTAGRRAAGAAVRHRWRGSPRSSTSTWTTSTGAPGRSGRGAAAVRQGPQGAHGAGRVVRPEGGRGVAGARPAGVRAGASGPSPALLLNTPGPAALAAERLGGAAEGGRRRAPGRRGLTRTPCGTPSPPTCSTAAPTSGWCRNCSGHASVTTTQIYTLVTVDHLREVFLSAHPRAALRVRALCTGSSARLGRGMPRPGPTAAADRWAAWRMLAGCTTPPRRPRRRPCSQPDSPGTIRDSQRSP